MTSHARLVFVALAACTPKHAYVPPPMPVAPPTAAANSDAGVGIAAASDAAPVGPTFPGMPATPAGQQLGWLFDGFAHRGGVFASDELLAHFADAFLIEVPRDELGKSLAQIAKAAANLVVGDVIAQDNGNTLVARMVGTRSALRVTLTIDAETHKILGLRFKPEVVLGPKPATFDEAQSMASALAPKAQLLVAELVNGTCKPTHAFAADDELAVGSAFKLYVLLALADDIIAGKRTWDDELEVRDDWKSLPSGITQNDAAGTKLSLRTLAERMISISDNTATDHLFYTLGRAAPEKALRGSHHAHPELDTPFLSTRELFWFRLGMHTAEVDHYAALAPTAKRAFLDHDLAGKLASSDTLKAWTGARDIAHVGWFASSMDVCRVMAALHARASDAKAAPLLDILAINGGGVALDNKAWRYIGFKSGSEPGVVEVTWLLRRDDDKWFVVAANFNAADGGTVDEPRAFGIAEGLLSIAAKER